MENKPHTRTPAPHISAIPAASPPAASVARSMPELCRDCGRLALSGPTITIPVADYAALLRDASAFGEASARPHFRAASRSPIARNGDLATFILQSAATMELSAIREAVAERFGRTSAPSRSAIHRFIRSGHKAGFT